MAPSLLRLQPILICLGPDFDYAALRKQLGGPYLKSLNLMTFPVLADSQMYVDPTTVPAGGGGAESGRRESAVHTTISPDSLLTRTHLGEFCGEAKATTAKCGREEPEKCSSMAPAICNANPVARRTQPHFDPTECILYFLMFRSATGASVGFPLKCTRNSPSAVTLRGGGEKRISRNAPMPARKSPVKLIQKNMSVQLPVCARKARAPTLAPFCALPLFHAYLNRRGSGFVPFREFDPGGDLFPMNCNILRCLDSDTIYALK
jgi:hypothetical protein